MARNVILSIPPANRCPVSPPVKSGHYVWPAAPALCEYLIHRWQALPHGKVLELGAGCGLAGLVAAQLPGTDVVVFTDHDPGSRTVSKNHGRTVVL